jgi:hypothetical protein
MKRKYADEIRERLEGFADTLDLIATKASLTPEQITNINLTAIAQQLADISLTLAVIADKLGGEGEGEE